MPFTDVFLCYREPGAQTAKLFKRYLEKREFPGNVWYSNGEVLGNYKKDIPELIGSAKCAVLFINKRFTANFSAKNTQSECITAIEVSQIARKIETDNSFKIITVFLDRNEGFTAKESAELEQLFARSEIADVKTAVKAFSQSNMCFFSTVRDDEELLFGKLEEKILPIISLYSKPRGNFYFGKIPTTVDVIFWDNKGLEPQNISFQMDTTAIASVEQLYHRIQYAQIREEQETQNNTMLSFVDLEATLSDDTEEKNLCIHYKKINYHLFAKTLNLWKQFELDAELLKYNWRTDPYPIPNAMGLAFTVITSDNKLIFTQRSRDRKVRPNEYDCSVVEGLKTFATDDNGTEYDISDPKYIEKEIRRAYCEEICRADVLAIKIYGLVIDKTYGQWNFVGTIRTSQTAADIRRLHAMRDDTYEVTSMKFVDIKPNGKSDLAEAGHSMETYLNQGLWDMALTAVYAAFLEVGFSVQDIEDLSQTIISQYSAHTADSATSFPTGTNSSFNG